MIAEHSHSKTDDAKLPVTPVLPANLLRTIQMRDFAERLVAHEVSKNGASGTTTPAASPVCEKLRPHLANLMGRTGFHALLSRALTRAGAEVPSLRSLQVNADGSLTQSDNVDMRNTPDELAAGSVVLVAQLLDLLVAFIGEKLTLQIVRDVWPKLALDDLTFSRKDTK